ncbi:MAG: hypothetical protein OXF74_08080 [Rhodobacteraceae bacterium]|nr:hypothetical protein [Paracoccaceae bacterium]
MHFSERHDYKEPRPMLVENELPRELRNRIWNVLLWTYFDDIGHSDIIEQYYSEYFNSLTAYLRHSFFKVAIDERPTFPSDELKFVRSCYFRLEFPGFYDFLEEMAGDAVQSIRCQFHPIGRQDQFIRNCNTVLEQEKAQFRFISNLLTPITNEVEMGEVERAVSTVDAREHIRRAIQYYRVKNDPSYRNSVKESISAVEATYRNMTGQKHKNIGQALDDMARKGMNLPIALKEGFSKIYGWTSGEDGIRHALMESGRSVTEAEARLMLVMCSAYVNYLLSLRDAQLQ